MLRLVLLITLTTAVGAANANSVQQPKPGLWRYETPQVKIRVLARAPDGVAAFYEARGFPPQAIALLRQSCFIGVSIRNKGREILWLEPRRWRITGTPQPVARYNAEHWRRQFDVIDLPLANRAAFRWTQLPEQRDLRHDEPVGGNITLPFTTGFDLEMVFDLGVTRHDRLQITFPNVSCTTGAK